MRPSLLNLFSALSILLLVAFSQSISWAGAQTPQRDNRPRTAVTFQIKCRSERQEN
jgi:hypothetical protein